MIRSDVIRSPEDEQRILAKAWVSRTKDGRIPVLFVSGTPYERGFQHGALLRAEVQDNLQYLYDHALQVYRSEVIFEEAFERLRPHIPEEYMQEMQGLAHGAKLPLQLIHYVHTLPSLTEWGGKKRLKEIAKSMMRGDLGTSCSNFSLLPGATEEAQFLSVRILDWGLHKISKLHKYPLVTVSKPDTGFASANLTWVGFLGAVSGMNEQGITLGEMGYGDPPNESLHGKPMIFLLRDILAYADSLDDVRTIISSSPGTNSFGFLMTDGKTKEAELYIRDPGRFEVIRAGEDMSDQGEWLPGIADTVYGGHYEDRMAAIMQEKHGQFSISMLEEDVIPALAMSSNFQNVVYSPSDLTLSVSYSPGPGARAAEAPYSFFDLGEALRDQRNRLDQMNQSN